MEVHHHPDLHEKKKFITYFLEFIMIFLAVTLGFFAENLREVFSEHETVKRYATEMVSDLATDTSLLKRYVRYMTVASNNVDTLLQLLTVNDPKDIPTGKLYWYGLTGSASATFRPNDASFQQMKSSGSLRFMKKSIAQKIAEYDQLCRSIQATEETDRGIYVEVRKVRAQIMYFKYNAVSNDIFQEIISSGYNKARADSFVRSNPPLLSTDKVLFNEYAEMVRSRFLGRKLTSGREALTRATALLTELKKEYDVP